MPKGMSDSDKGHTTSSTYKSDGNLVRNIGGNIIKAVNRQSKAVSFTYI
jgi:hypothetical protein